ncbi:MAG: hypothetical protein WC663_00990 [Patescibacteria group bacterium]|jgi:hypothetical protein
MDRKRILIIIGIVALIIAFAATIYFVIFRKQTKVASDLPALNESEQQRLQLTNEERAAGVTEDQKIQQYVAEKRKEIALQAETAVTNKYRVIPVLNQKSISPTLSADFSKLIFYSPENKEFYVANLDGSQPSPITSSAIDKVYDISWSKKKDRAVMTLSDNQGLTRNYLIFDINNQKQTPVDPNFKSPTLSPDGEKIAYLFKDKASGTSNISVSNLDGTNWNSVSPFEGEFPIINWNLESKLLYYSEPSTQTNATAFSANIIGKSFNQLVSDFGLNVNISNDGNKIVYSGQNVSSATTTNLQFYDVLANKNVDLGVQTFADKCTWLPDNQNLICAIPENLSKCMILPDAYNNYNFVSKDSFFKVDTQNNKTTKLADTSLFAQDYDVFKPFMLGEKIMYFTRRQDGLLYAFVIP